MIPSFWEILIVIDKHGLQEGRYESRVHLIEVVRMIDVSLHKFENFFLDSSQSTYTRRPSCNRAFRSDCVRDELTAGTVKSQHVEIDPAELRQKPPSNWNTYSDICLQDWTQHFYRVRTRQDSWIFTSLSDNWIPGAVRSGHKACKHSCLATTAWDMSDDQTTGFVESMYLGGR